MKRKYGQTVRVNGDRLAPIKKVAAEEKKTVGEVVGEAIDQYIAKRERKLNRSDANTIREPKELIEVREPDYNIDFLRDLIRDELKKAKEQA